MHEVKRPAAFRAPTGRVIGMRDAVDFTRNRAQSQRLGAAGIIVRLMRECEGLRDENARLSIALRGYDVEPQSPFPLLSGGEILRILHPEGDRASPKTERITSAEVKWAIAKVTRQLAQQARPAAEIKAAVLAEAERGGVSCEDALAISANIIREKIEEFGHA